MSRQEEWTRENEARALTGLQGAPTSGGPVPIVLVYTRQSVSDFDQDGIPRGPSLNQQFDAVIRRPEFQGLSFEHYQDADRSGKETTRRPGYQALMDRIRTTPEGQLGAVAFYEQDRLHRNVVEFYNFMAECEKRGILVFEANGLIRPEDELSWGIKAVFAQTTRKAIAKRVKDNLRYLKRKGILLGVTPQGYRRENGTIVEDPQAGPIIRDIFRLYASGSYSFATLADHLNQQGIKPPRGPEKANHNRLPALIFTGDVLKDILNNPSYLGKVRIDEQLVDGRHPALVLQETWDRCLAVRTRNRRRTSKTWTRYSYPLTPILRCGRCGSKMHGEASPIKPTMTIRLYYGCHARRRRLARNPEATRCDAPYIRAAWIEEGIRDELRYCLPSAGINDAYRGQLRRGLQKTADPLKITQTALRRLDEQLARVIDLYEVGAIDRDTFFAKWPNQ